MPPRGPIICVEAVTVKVCSPPLSLVTVTVPFAASTLTTLPSTPPLPSGPAACTAHDAKAATAIAHNNVPIALFNILRYLPSKYIFGCNPIASPPVSIVRLGLSCARQHWLSNGLGRISAGCRALVGLGWPLQELTSQFASTAK